MDSERVDVYPRSDRPSADSSDSSSDDDSQQQSSNTGHSQRHTGFHSNQQASGTVHPHFVHTVSSEEEDERGGSAKAVDPAPFQYNKRVFITALPCLLLTLAMTGEMLVLLVSVGGLVIVLMTHMGQDVSRKCVVVFALLFIPCQILVVGTILPLLWLSVWNMALVGLVNMFCILTGSWIILQFAAFRKEEPALCVMIEQGLFALYPFVCCALVTWVLSTVVTTTFIPFIFLFLWFVYLQLYLMPAASSFRQTHVGDEDFNIIQQPFVIAIIIVFIASGPAVYVILTLAGTSPTAVLSLSTLESFTELRQFHMCSTQTFQPRSGRLLLSAQDYVWAQLSVLLCLGLFLATLLSLRQLCDYMGVPHPVVVQVRWASGAGVVLLAYPTLQHLGMVSHFLLSFPLAVAAFAALGLSLSLRKGKGLSLLLVVVVMLLLCLWLYRLPWALTYHFLGVLPLRSLHMLVGVNFVLCVLILLAAWHCSMELFGGLLLLQSAVTTVCETGLYQAGLYPLPTFQLTGVVAAYTLHRLYVASRIARNTATMASAIQLTKTTIGALGYVRRVGGGGEGKMDVSVADFATLLMFVGVLVWLFVYETKEELTLMEVAKHVTLLMISMAASTKSLLVPMGRVMLQTDPTSADLVALWLGVGGVLILLCALQHGQCPRVRQQLMKAVGVMGVVGALVTITQPQFDLSLFSLYQWCEVLSLLLTAVVLTVNVEMRLSHTLLVAGVLGLCPGLRAAWLVYGEEVTVLHFVLTAVISCCLLAFLVIITKTLNVSDTTESFFKSSTVAVGMLLVAALAVDTVSLQPRDSMWKYPVWRLAFGVTVCVSIFLNILTVKLGPGHLPLTKRAKDDVPVIPVIANVATVSAFLLARTQGPQDILLHDLWCCAASVLLILLQRDSVFLSSLSPCNRATPIIMAAVGSLVFSTLTQSHLWHFKGTGSVILGGLEVVNIILSLPVYVVLLGILWQGEVWSEKAVVFTMPLNAFIFLLASGYTAWALCVAGFVCGIGMMVYKLPMIPHQAEAFS